MKIPKEIKGKNKVRDLDICRLYIDGLTPEEIKTRRSLNVTVRRIQKIISENAAFVNPRIGWDKAKRLHQLQQMATAAGLKLGKGRDQAHILEQIRKEIEGDKPLIDNSTHTHVVYEWNDDEDSEDRLSAPAVSEGRSQIPQEIQNGSDRKTGWKNGFSNK